MYKMCAHILKAPMVKSSQLGRSFRGVMKYCFARQARILKREILNRRVALGIGLLDDDSRIV